MTQFLVGRDRELAQIALSIGNGSDGLRLAMLSGPSGLGKTTLATRAIEQAKERGFHTVAIRGRAGSLSTPYAPLLEAFPELGAILTVLASNDTSDIDHAGMGLVRLVSDLAENKPVLIVIDDAQALDESTIAVLPFLSGISENANVTLLFVEQTDAIGVSSSYRSYVDGLLARRVVGHLKLGPLSDDSIRAIIAHELGLDDTDSVDPESVDAELVDRAQGNPWFAKELAHGKSLGSSEIPTTIAAAATARLHSLDEVGQDMVSTISICPDGAHIGWLEALSGQRPRHFVKTMERVLASGLVREDGEILTIAHPLMQQALVDELSAAMRRAIHIELVDALAEQRMDEIVTARARAYHLAASGRADLAIDEYLIAARSNEIRGKLHEALADLKQALNLEDRIEERMQLLTNTAAMATQVNSPSALALWNELARYAASSRDNETYAYALHNSFVAEKDHQNTEPLSRAAALGADKYGWSALASAQLELNKASYEEAISWYEKAIELSKKREDNLLDACAMRGMAVAQAELGSTSDALQTYREAVTKLINIRYHDQALYTWGSMISALIDDTKMRDAISEAEAADAYAAELKLDQIRPYTIALRAEVYRSVGDLEQANTLINEAAALDAAYQQNPAYPIFTTAFVQIIRADIANEMGSSNAQDLADLAMEVIAPTGYESWIIEAKREQLRATAHRSGIDSILSEFTELEHEIEPIFVATTTLWLLRQSVLNDAQNGINRVRELRRDFAQWETCERSIIARDEIDATLGIVDGQAVSLLDVVAKRWADAGCALDALRVNAIAGSLALKAGDKKTAKTYLQTAKDGLSKSGASADADLVAARLRQTGTRSRAKSRTTSVGPLTKRELEIARLVAQGLKNSEVASTLFLAEKTVAAHLSNIYGKVEVRSRVQLGTWIRANDAEFSGDLVETA